MSPLLSVGTAWRATPWPPQRFSLRIYVPAEDLDGIYLPLVPHAVSPEEGGVQQLSEQLSRLATAEDGTLPPRTDALWTLPRSTAPAVGADDDDAQLGLFHPSQRLRRALRLVEAAEHGQEVPMLPLLLPQDEVASRSASAAPEHFLPLYARQADWTVPVGWFALFRDDELVRVPFGSRTVFRLSTTAALAAERAERAAVAVKTLNREDLEELGGDLGRLAAWTGSFGPRAIVCLDYGSIADTLQPDESPKDMEDAVAFLEDDDIESAAVALRRLVRRWFPLAQQEYAN